MLKYKSLKDFSLVSSEKLFTHLTAEQSAACYGGADEYGAIAYSATTGSVGM